MNGTIMAENVRLMASVVQCARRGAYSWPPYTRAPGMKLSLVLTIPTNSKLAEERQICERGARIRVRPSWWRWDYSPVGANSKSATRCESRHQIWEQRRRSGNWPPVANMSKN